MIISAAVAVKLLYNSYVWYFENETQELSKILIGKEEARGGVISKIGNMFNTAGSIIPDTTVGIATKFIASVLKHIDKQQQPRINQLAKIVSLPQEGITELANFTAKTLAKSYATQITSLNNISIAKLSYVAVARAFEYLAGLKNLGLNWNPNTL
ncbi:MAG: hypothetical protein AB8V23_03280 [Candidatus Midichloria sp.]|uniref:Uncharacterized protein n=1 Tax=Hyalomma marginatum TaxID=34627 RepID=A0A8S4BUS5_9ACAR|nr:hypothetical protein MHYMCMPASI_00537 [Hyalomma marginatum]CAG7592949.1 hypothetical protein MHYMCMPSP_00762 [Hyalomma marginatum]